MITIEAQMNAIRNLTDQSRRCIFMKRSVILWLAVSAVIMFALPWLAVTFVKGDAGMAVCFMLFLCCQPNIFYRYRSICRKRHETSLEFTSYFSNFVSDGNMDFLRYGRNGICHVYGHLFDYRDSCYVGFYVS